jgi:glutamine amidotransferase
MEVTLIDSPYSNAANIARALRRVGAELRVTRDAGTVASARKLVLPGVGSFGAALAWLRDAEIDDALRAAVSGGASLLGICVGHQLLFDSSNEMGTFSGLGLVRGAIAKYDGALPVPQIGWNRVHYANATPLPLFDGVADGTAFYFVNSYAARETPHEIARGDYNGAFTAAVQHGRVFGVQFHPEKSSTAGLRVLQNFVELPA